MDINNNTSYHATVTSMDNTLVVNSEYNICSFDEIIQPLSEANSGLLLTILVVSSENRRSLPQEPLQY